MAGTTQRRLPLVPAAGRVVTNRIAGREIVGEAGGHEVRDPGTGEPLATFSLASTEQCLLAVGAADAAMPAWAATPSRTRSDVLLRSYQLLIERADEFAHLITLESGKTLRESAGEVRYAADFLRWFAEEAVRIGGDYRESPSGDKHIVVRQRPVGVALLITPWNFPLAMLTRKVGPALAAGCTTVIKPAAETPLTAVALVDLLAEAGAPRGTVNLVLAEPPAAAVAAMLADGRVRKLSFTGSSAVGAALAGLAAPQLIRTSLELGGNAPFLVLDDADVELAVEAALVAKLRNAGASCVAANRIYVHASRYQEFLTSFTEAMRRVRVGRGDDPDADVGAIITAAELAKLNGMVGQAQQQGGALRLGGESLPGPGWFFPPTVLADVPADAPVLAREIFGPIAPVVTFSDVEDVLTPADNGGLIAYVITRNAGAALRLAERLDVGMVAVNRGVISDAAAPFGGNRGSGLGREGGLEGIREYLETQYIGGVW